MSNEWPDYGRASLEAWLLLRWHAMQQPNPTVELQTALARLHAEAAPEAERTPGRFGYVHDMGDEPAPAPMTRGPRCDTCEKPAACVGRYEGREVWELACNDCCGHGCEDGICYPLAPAPSPVTSADRAVLDAMSLVPERALHRPDCFHHPELSHVCALELDRRGVPSKGISNDPFPPGCHCPPDKCLAPRIMGRQMPCRRAAARETESGQ